jgi:hypothetical protein
LSVPNEVSLILLGVSKTHDNPLSAGRGDGIMLLELLPGGTTVPIIEPVIIVPAQAGKQLVGPDTVPEIIPVTVPELGRVTASVAVKIPLKLPVTGRLISDVLPSALETIEVIVPTKLPTTFTVPGC